jgi:DNA polymerase-3 subunit gamma/tau
MIQENDSLVFYRKYRPKTFEEVLGEEHITDILKNAVLKGKISHAYLFSGERGTGKTTVARIFAKAVNCVGASDRKPCGKCEICEEFDSGKTLDLVELDAASARGIDEIRVLKEAVRFLPFKAKYRVYIIDEVHMLTREAFNALLKTLEEPPAHIIFILATTEPHKVPETIVSRTERYNFRRIPENLIAESLSAIAKKEGIEVEKEAVNLLSFFADGALRDAQAFLGQMIASGENPVKAETVRKFIGAPPKETIHNLVSAIINKEESKGLSLLREAEKNNIEPKILVKFLLRIFRFMYMFSLDASFERELKRNLSEAEFAFVSKNAKTLPIEKIETILTLFLETHRLISTQEQYMPYLPLELTLHKIISKI